MWGLSGVLVDAALLLLAAAEPAAPPEGSIVVTASRIEAAPAGGPTTIGASEIERLQPASLLEALDEVAGVRAFSTGGAGGRSFLSIRGGEPNFTLVLVEGIKLNDPTNSRGGGFDFFALDPALVERIEVARDAVSAVHGSDALAGAVNIRLRSPRPGARRVTARAQAGSEGEAGLGASFEAGWSDGGLLAAANGFDSGLTEGSSLDRRQGLVNLRQRLGGFEARLLGLHGTSDRLAFPEDSGGPRLAVVRERETGTARLAAAGLTVRRDGTAAVRPGLSLSWSRQEDRSATPAIAPGALQGTPALAADSRFSRVEAIADAGFGRGPAAATLGVALLRESGRSDGLVDLGFPLPVRFDLRRTTRSAFAEASLRPGGGFGLNLAGRYDDVAAGPHRWTGRAAVSWRPAAAGPTLFAKAGEGYKLPSFYALAHPLIGNPDLRPERSRNLEAGIEWALPSGDFVRLAFFENRFRDLIDFDPETFTTVNRDRVRASGAEIEGRWRPADSLSVAGALSWLDLDSATPLRGRPRWQGSLRAAWQASPPLELNVAVRFNSDHFDSSIPTGPVRADGHWEADLGARLRVSRRFSLVAAVRNLTGERFEDAVGFPAPGRLARVTVAAEF
ncbi:MAG TPA: TonB-dependent receptor [Allosphingosinicella sp.]|jgi:outer membrane receptor protein involved in Fe transport